MSFTAPATGILPPLPFGQSRALISHCVDDLSRSAGKVMAGDWDLQSPLPPGDFKQQSTAVNLNGLGLVALSSGTLNVKRDDVPYATLMLGFAGQVDYLVGGQKHTQRAGHTAVLLSGQRRQAYGHDHYGSIQIALDPTRLNTTLAAMLGMCSADSLVRSTLAQDQTLSLVNPVLDYQPAFMQAFRFINQFSDHADVLGKLAIDDALYRLIVTLLFPRLFIKHLEAQTKMPSRQSIDMLCQNIRSRLAETITLTDMEQMTGLSARSLQYAFRKKFNCSPMQWVRQERLDLARQQLIHADHRLTIAEIAYACGFTNLGNFARIYAAQFGELPSETLQKKTKITSHSV